MHKRRGGGHIRDGLAEQPRFYCGDNICRSMLSFDQKKNQAIRKRQDRTESLTQRTYTPILNRAAGPARQGGTGATAK